MTQRTYKIMKLPAHHKGHTIGEFEGGRGIAFAFIPEGTEPGVAINMTERLRESYTHGREDRSEEILGDAGLSRAIEAVQEHEWDPAIGETELGHCRCDPIRLLTLREFRWHLAYEVLQAAAAL